MGWRDVWDKVNPVNQGKKLYSVAKDVAQDPTKAFSPRTMAASLGGGLGVTGYDTASGALRNMFSTPSPASPRFAAGAVNAAAEQAAARRFQEGAMQNIEQGLGRGQALGEQMFATGSLGRLDPARSAAMQSVLSRAQGGLEGYNAPEMQAMRESARRGIDQNAQTSLEQMRRGQNIAGNRSGIAAAQQARLLSGANRDKAQLEQDIMVRNADAQRQALQNYYSMLGGQEGVERGLQQFNLGQQNAELQNRLQTMLGFGQLYSAPYTAAQQFAIGSRGRA